MKLILKSKKKAQSLIEYALILAMVAVVAIAALQLLGNNIGTALRQSSDVVGTGAEEAGKTACEAMGEGFTWDEGSKKCSWSGGGDGGGD